MPLYKITSKRLKRKQRDEESGLADIKAALKEELGEDEEQSESGSDDSESSAGGSEIDDEESDDESDADEGEEAEGVVEDGEEGVMSGESDGSDEEAEDEDEAMDARSDASDFPISVQEAATSPIYTLGESSDGLSRDSACVLCPGRIMRNDHMIKTHLESKAHKRSVKRYEARLQEAEKGGRPLESEDPRDVVEAIYAELDEVKEGKAPEAKEKVAPAEASSEPNGTAKKRKLRHTKAQRQEKRAKQLLELAGLPAAATAAPAAEKDEQDGSAKPAKKSRKSKKTSSAAAQAGAASPSSASKPPKDGAHGNGAPKLNRKARRMAARAAAGGDQPSK